MNHREVEDDYLLEGVFPRVVDDHLPEVSRLVEAVAPLVVACHQEGGVFQLLAGAFLQEEAVALLFGEASHREEAVVPLLVVDCHLEEAVVLLLVVAYHQEEAVVLAFAVAFHQEEDAAHLGAVAYHLVQCLVQAEAQICQVRVQIVRVRLPEHLLEVR